MKRQSEETKCWLLLLLLVGLVFAVFLPALKSDFINFDDNEYIFENPQVQRGLSWDNILWAFSSSAAANWHPLTWLSHLFDCELFGLNPWGHHLTSILLHAANTMLLFLMLRQLTGATYRSFLVAAFFGVHPLHVESVAWVSERKDVLSTLFFLLTIVTYARYVRGKKEREERPEERGRKREDTIVPVTHHASRITHHSPRLFYCLSLLLFTLGLMSKPMLVTLPFVLLLLDYWPLERVAACKFQLRSWGRLAVEKAPFFALAFLASIVTFRVQRQAGAVWDVDRLALLPRMENALVAYCRYLGKLFWPSHLSVFYPHPGGWPVATVVLAALLLLAISVAVIIWRKRAPYGVVGWFWFLGTLVPVIGLVQVGWQSLADRYTYIPSIGFFILVIWAAGRVQSPKSKVQSREIEIPGLADPTHRPLSGLWTLDFGLWTVLILICAMLAHRQARFWRNSETLFRHSLEVTSHNYVAHHNLGVFLLGQKKFDEAIDHFRQALRLRPRSADSYNGLGEALLGQGRTEEAITFFHEAVKFRPNMAVARNNLGIAMTKKGLLDQAIIEFEEALKVRPDYAKALNNLGMALQGKGRLDEAIIKLQQAVKLAPDDAEAHNNLAMALGRKGRLDEAIAQLQLALRLNPKYAQAHNNLGLALSRQGHLEQAISHFEKSLQLNPDSPETHTTFATVLAEAARRDQAIAHLKQALKLRPGYAPAEQQLRLLQGGQ